MSQYFFNDKSRSPKNKLQTSGSFGFKSSQFSQKDNNSIGEQVKNINPSIFNQSSIQKLNNSESGEFIYFQNDSVLSELQNELKGVRKATQKQSSGQKKKKQAINYSKEISFQDSLQKSKNLRNDSFQIDEYGTGKNGLPPSLKKPKFGFKTSETAESSAIIKQIGDEYQIAENKKKEKKENSVSMYSNEMSRNQQRSKNLTIERSNRLQPHQASISSIKGPAQQPSIASKPLSDSKSMSGSMNFKSAFKHKKQKASMINSSLNKHKHTKSNQSISLYHNNAIGESYVDKNFIRDREVKVAELNDLRELENKLGEINHQNRKIIQMMIQKDQQIQRLKRKKIQIQAEDPYAIIKQNQLMKAFLNNKPNKKSSLLNSSNNLRAINSAKSLNQQTLKRSSQISSLHDYDIKQHKFRVQPKVLTKMQKKTILSNRGMVLSQKYLDVGFSMKDNVLTIYLTLKRQYDEVGVRLQENSFVMSDNIDRIFKDSAIGKQIKFKTEIKSTKCKNPEDNFDFPSLKISLKDQQRFENKLHQFKVDLPVTVYNVAKQLQPSSTIQSISKASSAKEVFKTQTFVGCKELIRQPESYLMKLFPTGHYQKDQNAFYIGFLWKQKRDFLKIRIKERSFLIEGQGNPNIITFEVLRSIVSLLIEEKALD